MGGSGRLARGGRNWGRQGEDGSLTWGPLSGPPRRCLGVVSESAPAAAALPAPTQNQPSTAQRAWVERRARLGRTLPVPRPAGSRPSFTGAGVVGWPGWLLCSQVGMFFALGAGPRAVVVVDNHTPGRRALARGTRLERVIPTQNTLRTCRLTSGHLSTAGTWRGEGGKCEDRSFPPGGAPAGAQTPGGYVCARPGWARASARTGRVVCKGSLAFPGSRAAGAGPFEHLHSLWGPGTVCNVRMAPQSTAPSRKRGTFRTALRAAEAGRPCLSGRWRPGATCWPDGGRRLRSEVLLCREAWALGDEGRAFNCCTGAGETF